MLATILRFLRLRSTEEIERENQEAIDQGFHDLPDPRERARMSPERLAILLSQQRPDTPAYILVEHELDLRIASIQSKATVRSGWLGLIGALLGAMLGFFWNAITKSGAEPPRAGSSLRVCWPSSAIPLWIKTTNAFRHCAIDHKC